MRSMILWVCVLWGRTIDVDWLADHAVADVTLDALVRVSL